MYVCMYVCISDIYIYIYILIVYITVFDVYIYIYYMCNNIHCILFVAVLVFFSHLFPWDDNLIVVNSPVAPP